jgi:hypothetical protein
LWENEFHFFAESHPLFCGENMKKELATWDVMTKVELEAKCQYLHLAAFISGSRPHTSCYSA